MIKQNKKLVSISIVIPAFNEEENISWVTKDALKSLPKFFKDFEIIIVDDGSKDQTSKIADTLAKNKRVKVIHQPNGGYSKAMLSGITKAKKDYVAYMPADGQFLVKDMVNCFNIMEENDLVLGFRGGRPDYSFYRLILSYGYLLMLWLLFGINYKDVGWVNIWKTKKVQGVKPNGIGGIFILTEIVVKFKNKGYKIAEARSYYHPRKSGEVKNAKFKVVKDTFLNAFKLWFNLLINNI